MNVLGIPAHPQGNLIHIRDQTVGVSEACSGIRSLQATLMAGLLLGELARLSWPRRGALLGCGLALALAANVFRSSLLVWIAARHGAAALEQVHDFAGFSVLVIVFLGLLGINRWLAPGQPPPGDLAPAAEPRIPLRRVPGWMLVTAAAALMASEAGTAAWYGLSSPAADRMASWTVSLPAAPGCKNLPIDSRTTQMLRYDQAISAHWSRPGPPPVDGTLFFFRWEPGHASGTQAEMHQPHVCLTASGMTEVADWGVQPVTLPSGLQLPVRRYEFSLHGRTLYVFSWHCGMGWAGSGSLRAPVRGGTVSAPWRNTGRTWAARPWKWWLSARAIRRRPTPGSSAKSRRSCGRRVGASARPPARGGRGCPAVGPRRVAGCRSRAREKPAVSSLPAPRHPPPATGRPGPRGSRIPGFAGGGPGV